VRWYPRFLILGLLAAGCSLSLSAREPKKTLGEPTCGEYGTSVHFEKTPKEAAKKALQEEKLVFVVHVSGIFEKTELT
jgi:hypothetical protein